MRRMMGAVIICMVWGLVAGASARAQDAQVTYVRAGKMLDVRAGKMLADQVIVIRGERIDRVGAAADISIPAGAKVIDLSDATVLPGLIDGHEHIFLTGEDNGRYDEQLLKESYQYQIGRASCRERV